jgi:glutamate racemase
MDAEQAHRGSLSARAPPARRPDYDHGVHAELPIGMFDSGVGGLTVLHECLVTMPHEDFLYAGDTAHFPYGGRSAAELRAFSQEIAGWLVREGVKLIVVACNSATATALGDLQQSLDVPVIGVLTPEARAAVQLTRNRRVGLLATEATVASGRYRELVRGLDAGIELVEVPCPGLADAIQRGESYDETMVERVRVHCAPLREAGVDTVILGCTHYPLIRGILQRELGRDVSLVAAAEELAEEVAATLSRKRLARDHGRRGSYRFACTADAESFAAVGRRFLQLPISSVRTLGVGELHGLALTS